MKSRRISFKIPKSDVFGRKIKEEKKKTKSIRCSK